jgi:hypothetical protein
MSQAISSGLPGLFDFPEAGLFLKIKYFFTVFLQEKIGQDFSPGL